jgi:hypothetical protein
MALLFIDGESIDVVILRQRLIELIDKETLSVDEVL